MRPVVLSVLSALMLGTVVQAAPLTADDAVRLALEKSPSILRSNGSVLSARSGLWSAYSGILPSVGANASRSGSFTNEAVGTQAFGAVTVPRDPGVNQPGAAGNRGAGAPGVGVRDPGINQPGAAGNRGAGARRVWGAGTPA